MRYTKILRIFSLAIVLTLLLIAMPASPAVAALEEISLSPTEGKIGDTITINGRYFIPSNESYPDRHVDIYFSTDVAVRSNYIDNQVETYKKWEAAAGVGFEGDDDEGEFEDTLKVPSKLEDGSSDVDVEVGTTYYVYVTHYNSTYVRARAEFTVIGGEISIDPEEGPVGTEVEITGTEFVDNENITVYYDDDEIDIESGDDETDNGGDFECTILIPESTAGTHTIKVEAGNNEAETEFTVESELVIDPTSGEAGAEISVSGTGFDRRSDVVVYFDAEEIVADATDSDGSFERTFTVPELEVDIYDVEAEDEEGNLDTAKFTITVPGPTEPSPTPTPTPTPAPAEINISAESGKIGSDIVVTGAGFAASGAVTIKFGDEVLSTTVADASGIVVAIVKVPPIKAGEHTITISDGTNTGEVTFTVEAVPPPIPAPLLPEMGVKAKTPVTFDWEDVTGRCQAGELHSSDCHRGRFR